jgi:hypothetical protein
MTIWTGIMALWIGAGIAGASGDDATTDCVRAAGREACDAAGDVGAGIGVGILIVLWFVVFVALALVALLTRKREPMEVAR